MATSIQRATHGRVEEYPLPALALEPLHARFPLCSWASIVDVLPALSPESIVPEPFSLSKSECSSLSDPALRSEIARHTQSEVETSGILRSIDRFGADSSIERYEITPQAKGRSGARSKTVSWHVRAVRPSSS
jgi:hypothetical protein